MMNYLGRSMIVNGLVQDAAQQPDSDILAEAARGAKEIVVDADIPLRKQRKIRDGLPFHGDARSRLHQHVDDLDVLEVTQVRHQQVDTSHGMASTRVRTSASVRARKLVKRTASAPSMTR